MVWGEVAAGLLAIVIGRSGLRASRLNTKKHLLTIAGPPVACGHHPSGVRAEKKGESGRGRSVIA